MIEVPGGKHVVDSEPYGVVRHPMYGATLLPFLTPPSVESRSAIIEAQPTRLASYHAMAKETRPIRCFPNA